MYTPLERTSSAEILPALVATKDEQRSNADFMLLNAGEAAVSFAVTIESEMETGRVYPTYWDHYLQNPKYTDRIAPSLGVSGSDVWLRETVWAIAQGRRTVVTTPSFNIVSDIDKEDGRYVLPTELTDWDEMQFAFCGALRSLIPPGSPTKLLFRIHDYIDPVSGGFILPRAQELYRLQVERGLREYGAILPSDVRGEQYDIHSLSDIQEGYLEMTMAAADQSNTGRVGVTRDGAISFFPTPEIIETLSASKATKERLQKYGVTIRSSGAYSSDVIEAASIRKSLSEPAEMHLHIDQVGVTSRIGKYLLMRALGETRLERFHNVSLERSSIDPLAVPYYLLLNRIGDHARHFSKNLDRYEDFENFDPVEYVWRNYGERILGDDYKLCQMLSFALDYLGIENANTVDLGCGPNLYPAMLLAPHSREIDLLEYSSKNREFVTNWFEEQELSEDLLHVFDKFEDVMVSLRGGRYRGVQDKLRFMRERKRLRLSFGDTFNLPKRLWKVALHFFVGDSLTNQKLVFPDTVRTVKGVLDPEGVSFAAYMLNDPNHEGYQAGDGKLFPNVSQTATEIHNTYTDNDLVSAVIPTGDSDKARAGYDGMALVVSAHKGSEMAKKIPALEQAIREMLRLAA
jgi:hypothetical protein